MSAGRERRLTGAHTAEPRPPGGGLHQAAFPRGLGTDSPARGSDTAVSTAVGGQAAASSPVFATGKGSWGAEARGPSRHPEGRLHWSHLGQMAVWCMQRGRSHAGGRTRRGRDSVAGGCRRHAREPVLRSATITRAQAGIGPCATREGDGVKAAARPRPRTSARETARPTRGLRLPRVIGHGRGIQGPP